MQTLSLLFQAIASSFLSNKVLSEMTKNLEDTAHALERATDRFEGSDFSAVEVDKRHARPRPRISP